MTDYKQEQEMEIEALQAILMDDIQEVSSADCSLRTTFPCFQIIVSPKDDDEEEPTSIPVRLAVIFAHTENYPDEPPLLEVKSLQGVKGHDLVDLKKKLEQEAMENLGMAMMYTLVTSAKEWLREHYNDTYESDQDEESDEETKDEIIEPHGEAVTVETFLIWRERFEAEQALERARLIPDAALLASKEKRLTGRAWFETGAGKGAKATIEWVEEQDEEELDFEDDFDDGDIDEADMLEHYLSSKA
ncbi:hypothetical protein GOP47_0011402 [Adiantum capillus-veneris]|uniref:RWD domain-containing protein n=1 Tax=Adiantum capillus-veneris TaxID=13818 RepID=A0A9D4ZFD0_ADICA|nr:hypothetical protein GOP47_0011402 [Adiantum capillus-veneris]